MSEFAKAMTMVGQLETSMGVPTFAYLANWNGEYAVDADEEAGRILASMIIERLRKDDSEEIALILGARGGYPAFADHLLRTAWHLGVRIHSVVLCRIDGAVANVAVGSDSITLHPQAGLGALDRGLCVVTPAPLDSSLLAYWPVDPFKEAGGEPGREMLLAKIAHDKLIREELRKQASRFLERKIETLEPGELETTFEMHLGRGGTLDSWSLRNLGLEVRVAPGPLAEQLDEFLEWAGQHLHLFEPPQERYHVSNSFSAEVEFEPATRVEAAAILAIDSVWVHELDTGSPDPDAPRLTGRWRSWDPEAPLDLELELGAAESEL